MVWYPKATAEPVINHSGPMNAHLGLAVHVVVGNNDCFPEFNNAASQASSTWQAMKDGTGKQFVDSDLAAWCEAAGNFTFDSVETEGFTNEPLTPGQIEWIANLYAWGHHQYGWPLQTCDHDGSGLTTHSHYPSGAPDQNWGGHPCPGDIRRAQIPQILARAIAILSPTYPTGGPLTNYVGMACTPTGKGYWQVKADGSIITEGDAQYLGGANVDAHGKPQVLNKPIIGIAAHPGAPGYWLIAADGGVFAFGAAQFHGSAASLALNAPPQGLVPTPSGNGYWIDCGDGGVMSYGDAQYEGSGVGK